MVCFVFYQHCYPSTSSISSNFYTAKPFIHIWPIHLSVSAITLACSSASSKLSHSTIFFKSIVTYTTEIFKLFHLPHLRTGYFRFAVVQNCQNYSIIKTAINLFANKIGYYFNGISFLPILRIYRADQVLDAVHSRVIAPLFQFQPPRLSCPMLRN